MFKLITPLLKQNKSITFFKFFKHSSSNFSLDLNLTLQKIKDYTLKNKTEEAFYEMKNLIKNWDELKINYQEFLKILYDLNITFLQNNEAENVENLSQILMSNFDKNECDIPSIEWQINISEFYFYNLFKLDSRQNFKKCLNKIISCIEIEKFNENKENLKFLKILKIQCNLNLLRTKYLKNPSYSGISKELDILAEELNKILSTLQDKNQKILTIAKCDHMIGDIYYMLNKFDKALIHFNKIKNLNSEVISQVITEGILYRKLALCNLNLNQIDMTIFYLNRAISELEKILKEENEKAEIENFFQTDRIGQNKILNNFASVPINDSNLTTNQQIPIYFDLATVYDQLADIYIKEHNLAICKDLCIKAIDFFTKSKCDKICLINIFYNLCYIQFHKEEFEECILYGEKLIELIQRAKIMKISENNKNILNEMILNALKFLPIENYSIDAHIFLTNSYYALENFDQSKFYARELYKKTKNNIISIDFDNLKFLNQIANINLNIGNLTEALELSNLIMDKFYYGNNLKHNQDFLDEIVGVFIGKAEVLFQLQNHQLCKETYNEFLEFVKNFEVELSDEMRKMINDRMDQLDFLLSN